MSQIYLIRNVIADIRAIRLSVEDDPGHVYIERCLKEAIAHLELAIDELRELRKKKN